MISSSAQHLVGREHVLVDDRRRHPVVSTLTGTCVGLVEVEDHRLVVGRLDRAVGETPVPSRQPLLMLPSRIEEPFGSAISMLRSKVNFTSDDVRSLPLENFRPSCSVQVRVCGSSYLHYSAASPTGSSPSRGSVTSCLVEAVLQVPRAEVVGAGRVERGDRVGRAEDPGRPACFVPAAAVSIAVVATARCERRDKDACPHQRERVPLQLHLVHLTELRPPVSGGQSVRELTRRLPG